LRTVRNSDRVADRTGLSWYAVYTRHQHEKKIQAALEMKSIETFLPLYSDRSRWSDRVKIIERPLFPCYVFIHAGRPARVPVLSTPGVYSIVGGPDGPAAIPNDEIEALKRAVSSKLGIQPCSFLSPGDWVRIKDGPLKDVEGILVRRKNQQRLVLSVEMLQKSVAVEMDGVLVERVPRRQKPASGSH
jgi:transcription antitermination factor NusG